MAALSDVDPPREDADLVRRYLDRLAGRPTSSPAPDTEPDPPLRRHSGRSREDVWSP